MRSRSCARKTHNSLLRRNSLKTTGNAKRRMRFCQSKKHIPCSFCIELRRNNMVAQFFVKCKSFRAIRESPLQRKTPAQKRRPRPTENPPAGDTAGGFLFTYPGWRPWGRCMPYCAFQRFPAGSACPCRWSDHGAGGRYPAVPVPHPSGQWRWRGAG